MMFISFSINVNEMGNYQETRSSFSQTNTRLDVMRRRGETDKDRMLEPGLGVKITFRSDDDLRAESV